MNKAILLDGLDAVISFVVSQSLRGVFFKGIEKEVVRTAHKKADSVKISRIVCNSAVMSAHKGQQPTDIVAA